jgi:hypothetical protein
VKSEPRAALEKTGDKMSAKMEPGTYQCKTTAATIYEAPSGAVMCRMELDIGLKGGICLIQKDGTLSERGFKDAAAILGIEGGWDWALWEREPEAWAGHDVDAVVETVKGDVGEFSSVKYLNPPGGGGAKLEKPDAKALAAKYGAKTRALFGGAPAAPKPPAPKPPPPAPLAKPAATSTMEKCWERFCELNSSRTELDLYAEWPKVIQAGAGKGQNDCTPEDWGKVLAHVNGETLPY